MKITETPMLLSRYFISAKKETICSYNSPTNLFLMDLNNDTRIERNDRFELLIRTLPITNQQTCTVFGDISKADLIKLQNKYEVVETVSPPPLPFTTDKDNAEYVYSIAETIAMAGRRYENVRRKVNKIKTDKYQVTKKKDTKDNSALLWEFFADQVNSENIHKQIEAMAFEKWLLFSDHVHTDLVIASKYDEILGFAVVEVVNKTLLIHFFKTNKEIVGLAEYLFVSLAKIYEGKVEWINFQQDLGIQGLRTFKNHLQPAFQTLTFTISK